MHVDAKTIRRPRLLLLDMDGTLTRPLLNFDAIRAEMGITGPILEAMRHLPPEQRRLADEILDRHEARCACESQLNDGCLDLLAWLSEAGIRTGLVTRNSGQSVQTVLEKHQLAFELTVTRDHEPTKPHPAPLIFACDSLGVPIDHTWMVGDSHHDIDAGVAAKMRTVWISHGVKKDFAAEPWKTVITLHELLDLLRSTIAGPGGVSL